ncbi:hypothetical protein [Paracoccus marinaquae]|uniref:Uncharacterized protein n=1 Tax=Paracoccus marinaquae TaxID=2841926 RepID=A0ABS6AN59_9RHOB|nr:hypothetical protein [Paracoccus marinaquae]MBU3031074.1 hypothetical protein [Paracoccus marinaquae]
MTLRPANLSLFAQAQQSPAVIRGQNFTVHRFDPAPGQTSAITSAEEVLFILPGGGGTIRIGQAAHRVPPRSLVIAPQGTTELELDGPEPAYALTTGAGPDRSHAVNAADYATPDARVRPVSASSATSGESQTGLRIYPIDEVPFPEGNPRLKFLRTATMSVNWVEYDGPRNRQKLSPHAHTDFEQGSLAIAGTFIHHIRTPWGPDADTWREDQHIDAGADSLLIIPPELVHTTEGVGEGKHILIDIFAPAREDFIAKGWVHNADDYAPREPA